MKKTISISMITVLISLITFFIARNSIPGATKVQFINPQITTLSKDIKVTGKIEERVRNEVTAQFPFVTGKVYAEVGDTVKAGQTVCEIDVEATKEALFNLSEYTSMIPQEYKDIIEKIDVEKMLEKIPGKIAASADGVITSLNVKKGSICSMNSTVCVISDIDDVRINVSVDEKDADDVKEGDIVVFKAAATDDKKYYGKVERIFPTAAETFSGTSARTVVGVYVKPVEIYKRLKPGYTITGVIKNLAEEEKLTVPYEAVMQDEQNREYVYVYKNARAVRADITTGDELEDGIVVEKGLKKDDIIVKNGQDIKEENCFVKAD